MFEAMELPGIFKNKESPNVFKDNGGDALQADIILSILPDGKQIKREATMIIEGQKGYVNPKKRKQTFEYWLKTTTKHEKLCYPYIATDYDYKEDHILHTQENFTLSYPLKKYNQKEIYKILNTLNEKDYNIKDFTPHNYALSTICLIFGKKPYEKDVTEEIVKIFKTTKHISKVCQKELYLTLTTMIKYHFQDNVEKTKEMLTMITEVMHKENIENLPQIVEDRIALINTSNNLEQAKIKIQQMENDHQKEITKKDKEIEELKRRLKQYEK